MTRARPPIGPPIAPPIAGLAGLAALAATSSACTPAPPVPDGVAFPEPAVWLVTEEDAPEDDSLAQLAAWADEARRRVPEAALTDRTFAPTLPALDAPLVGGIGLSWRREPEPDDLRRALSGPACCPEDCPSATDIAPALPPLDACFAEGRCDDTEAAWPLMAAPLQLTGSEAPLEVLARTAPWTGGGEAVWWVVRGPTAVGVSAWVPDADDVRRSVGLVAWWWSDRDVAPAEVAAWEDAGAAAYAVVADGACEAPPVSGAR